MIRDEISIMIASVEKREKVQKGKRLKIQAIRAMSF